VHPLRALRLSRNFTLRRLEKKSGVPASSISRLERGLTPRPEQIARLAGALDLQPDNLQRVLALRDE
jgi:transcriptional regulator with XRE-family HTH domain